MQASHFFMMLDEALKIRAEHYMELAMISWTPAAKPEYLNSLREKYWNVIADKKVTPMQPKAAAPVMKAGSAEARDSVFAMFTVVKQGMGFSDG